MLIQPGSTLQSLLTGSRPLPAVVLVLAAFAALALAACSGDDDDGETATPQGSLVTTTPEQANATSQPQLGGTLVPGAPSPGPAAAASAQAPSQGTAGVATLFDMAPCGSEGESEVQAFDGVPALTYIDVPEGTPIVFPFEEGRLRHVDARQGAILIVYDVEGVGVFSVQAAGTETLDRLVTHPVAGTVIGHFNGVFEEETTHVFEGHQLFAVAGTAEMVAIGNNLFAGLPLELQVEDCLVLP